MAFLWRKTHSNDNKIVSLTTEINSLILNTTECAHPKFRLCWTNPRRHNINLRSKPGDVSISVFCKTLLLLRVIPMGAYSKHLLYQYSSDDIARLEGVVPRAVANDTDAQVPSQSITRHSV